ncbi:MULTISPECIES: type I polyketide synthase [unclassified Novosphingobium]|uniref:type I polyketide synthase n=1 Tax=unclassified Novosphingobium TaxID=2644732 RepID=UPI00135C2EFD|nr:MULTISPECIES: type I polyketide synthase [unclassified Novosphingobium]
MYRNDEHFEGQFPAAGGEEPENAIAIVGMSCRFAGARGIDAYWDLLSGGVEGIEHYSEEALLAAGADPRMIARPNYIRAGAPLADMECFDNALFGLSPRDAAIMDPQHRHFLECAWEAMEDAGHVADRVPGAIGVFGGTGHNAYLFSNLLTNPKLVRDVGPFLLRHTGNDKDFLSTRVSYLLNLKGPSVNVQTACSTSLVAIHSAVQSLLNRECDMALAGAASIELPHAQGYLYEEGEITSADGHCRPFDADSTGAVFGSGVGIVVLRRLEDALADNDHIYAVIRGSAVNNDGSGKVSYLSPSVDGHAGVVSEALDVAQVDARSVGYVEAHGTGTRVGDPIEIAALSQAYRRHTADTGFCRIGSVKGNIGHTDTAAGVASVIKVGLSLHYGAIAPTLHYSRPNPACDFGDSPFSVAGEFEPWPRLPGRPRRAGVSSLGVGGTNAHVIMEEAPPRAPGSAGRPRQVLTLSAQTATALEANAAALGNHLRANPGLNLADVAFTLSTGRKSLAYRKIIVARDGTDAAEALAQPANARVCKAVTGSGNRSVAFLFCGAGAQYAGMGAELYASEPLFRGVIDECLSHLGREEGEVLKGWLYPDAQNAEQAALAMQRPSIALPLLFSVQVALARLWMAWGVTPGAMIGHSSGEYAAAHLAGVLSLSDALTIVRARGRLFETVPGGAMLSVPMAEADIVPLLSPELSIAAVNGPKLAVVSGPAAAIAAFAEELAAREVETQTVGISVAAHSAMLDPILDAFRKVLATVRFSPPSLAFVSNLTGDWITAAQATDPEYWVTHLRQPVRFTDGLARLLGDPDRVLLEVGPGRVLSSLARQHPDRNADLPVLNSLPHKDERKSGDLAHVLDTLGNLWAAGVTPDWDAYWAAERRCRLPLPTYRFDRQRHWFEPGTAAMAAMEPEIAPDQPLPRHADMADWLYEPIWHRAAQEAVATPDGVTLVFEDKAGLGAEIAASLRGQEQRVISVRPGRRFRQIDDVTFEINVRAAEDYSRLATTLADRDLAPARVYHLWLVTGETAPDAAALQDLGLHSLVFLTQALGEGDTGPIAVTVVSDGVQRVCDEEGMVPAKATILGACRVIPREYPEIRVRSVDIRLPRRNGPAWATLRDMLIAESAQPDDAEVIAYRASERWTASFATARTPVTAPIPAEIHLKQEGVYLITGGLGGLGMVMAGHLARTRKARLALLARRALPPREQWQDIMARAGADPVARTIRKIRAIEAAGGEVMLIVADVCNVRAMRRAVKQIHQQWGPIDGVFHTAGVIDDGLLQLKTRSSIDRVLSPKLHGTLALDVALKDERPEFMLLFSSISAFAGIPGQVDYAAANAFLDAYAQSRRDDVTNVVSIAWSRWQDVGMAADLAEQAAGDRATAPLGVGEAMDHPFLHAMHRLSPTEVIVEGMLSPDRHWLLDEHRLADGSSLIPGTGFLELARAAFDSLEAGPSELADILFLTPFAVPDGESRTLRIHMHQERDGDWHFSILGRAVNGDPEQGWTEHVRGVIRRLAAAPLAPQDVHALLQRMPAEGNAEALVDASSMMRFGPRWRSVRQLRIADGEAVLELALDRRFAHDLAHIALHPALLDFATAGAQCLIPSRRPGQDFFAPASYGSIKLYQACPAHLVSHVRCRPVTSDAIAVFDVTLLDPQGRVIAEIAEFTMLRLSDTARLSGTETTAPRPASRPLPAEPASDGLVSAEGVAIVERVLAGVRASHVIISPTDLHQTLARIRAPYQPTAAFERDDEALGGDPPATAAERIIAEIWSEMLGVRHIQRSDDFFDLGGHSLLGVQFMNRLRKRTGKQLPLATLLESATVEKLGRLIDPEGAAVVGSSEAPEEEVAANRKIITIRPGSRKTPLFLVHDGLGETLLYRALAMRMDPDRPVMGIEPDVYAGGAYLHTSIAEMARAYIVRMQTVQPHGPYLIAGLCAGGVIAFEMARQLQEMGESTAFVGIVDAADVEAHKRSFYITRTRIQRVRALLRGDAGGPPPSVGLLMRRATNAVVYDVSTRLEWMSRTRKVARMAEGPSPANDEVQVAAPKLSFLHLYEVAHRAHRPSGLFEGGEVVLFKAMQGTGADDDVPYCDLYTDCIFGWGKRVEGDVTVVSVPGGHSSVLQEPNVDVLAGAMREAIARARPDEDVVQEPIPIMHAPPPTVDFGRRAETAQLQVQ